MRTAKETDALVNERLRGHAAQRKAIDATPFSLAKAIGWTLIGLATLAVFVFLGLRAVS